MIKFIFNVVFFIFILTSWHCVAGVPTVTKKYEYGYKYKDEYGFNVLRGRPEFHPLTNNEEYTFLSPGYLFNDVKNRQIQLRTNMFVVLLIEGIRNGRLKLTTQLINKSNKSYFIHSIFLTLFKVNSNDGYSSSCRQDLLIVTKSARLEYMGTFCHGYDDSPDSGDWVELVPGKIYSMSMYLDNTLYTFPSGHRMYSIGTLEYPFVDAQWFSHQRINYSTFNILKWRYECKVDRRKNYLISLNVCINNTSIIEDNFYKFIQLYTVDDNGTSQHEFKIRSEQILIDIDGSELLKNKSEHNYH
ncbi:hypothetical protein ACVUCS_004460 [Salmonella enterica subsp. enterica]|nr:hypothetical protein [Salmonella enterica subsp. enterica serovar Volkmarsdorf]